MPVFGIKFWPLVLINQAKRDLESNCHHHFEALVDQGLNFLCFTRGVYFPGVFWVDMNSSENTSSSQYRVGSVAGMSEWLIGWNHRKKARGIRSPGLFRSYFLYWHPNVVDVICRVFRRRTINLQIVIARQHISLE